MRRNQSVLELQIFSHAWNRLRPFISQTANMSESIRSMKREKPPVGIVINPTAFTHTSVAIMDAFETCECSILKVHISNVHQREAFRHHAYVSPAVAGVIAGFGTQGYTESIQNHGG
jgi:3-dehydroquinate dehydratase